MVARISSQDYQKLARLGGSLNPKKVWIKGNLTIKKASTCEKFFWAIAKSQPWMQKIFYGLNLKKSERALVDLQAKIVQAETKAGHSSQNLRALFNASIDNFQAVNKTRKPALTSLKFHVKPQTTFVRNKPNVTTTAKKVHYTVGSYNILFPQRADHTHAHATDMGYHSNNKGDVLENHAYRIKVISQNIRNANLDVNCLQEVSKESFETLQRELGDKYEGVWAPHKGTMPRPGSTLQQNNQGVIFNPDKHAHGVAIFYKKSQFNLVQCHVTKRFELTGIKKRHLMLDLKDKKTGLVTRYVTCHLTDPRQWLKNQKTQHIDAVLKDAHRNNKIDMIVVTGDMNQDQFGDLNEGKARKPADLLSATAFMPLVSNGYKHGASGMKPKDFPSTEVERKGLTVDDKDYTPTGKLVETGRMIDHIFMRSVNPALKPTIKMTGIPQNFDVRGSDHKMVVSVISI